MRPILRENEVMYGLTVVLIIARFKLLSCNVFTLIVYIYTKHKMKNGILLRFVDGYNALPDLNGLSYFQHFKIMEASVIYVFLWRHFETKVSLQIVVP